MSTFNVKWPVWQWSGPCYFWCWNALHYWLTDQPLVLLQTDWLSLLSTDCWWRLEKCAALLLAVSSQHCVVVVSHRTMFPLGSCAALLAAGDVTSTQLVWKRERRPRLSISSTQTQNSLGDIRWDVAVCSVTVWVTGNFPEEPTNYNNYSMDFTSFSFKHCLCITSHEEINKTPDLSQHLVY